MSGNQENAFISFMVVKFGGNSLADGERISKAVKAVAKELQKGVRIVVVVSAMGKTTDSLLDVIKIVTNNNDHTPSSDIDDILAMGERTSARIFSAALRSNSIECRYFDPAEPEWPLITNGKVADADPILSECEERIKRYVLPLLQKGLVVVLPGFVGKTLDGKITTMGRGGSDITALIVAYALKAKQVILVTDVDGVMTIDPKLVKSAKRIDEINVKSLIGLASSGSKFLQRKALKYKGEDIDVKIINYNHYNLEAEGTIVKGSLAGRVIDLEFPAPVVSITIVGEALSQSPDVFHRVTRAVKSAEGVILGASADSDSMIIYVPENVLEKIIEQIHSVVLETPKALAVAVRKNLALLKIKTAGLEETPGVISRLAHVLYARNINIYGIFTVASGIYVFVDMISVREILDAIKDSIGECFEMDYLKLDAQPGAR